MRLRLESDLPYQAAAIGSVATFGDDQRRRFEQAIERAIGSCQQSGNNPDDHFAGAGKMIEVGKGGQREVEAEVNHVQPALH